jgi:hypothetical protein
MTVVHVEIQDLEKVLESVEVVKHIEKALAPKIKDPILFSSLGYTDACARLAARVTDYHRINKLDSENKPLTESEMSYLKSRQGEWRVALRSTEFSELVNPLLGKGAVVQGLLMESVKWADEDLCHTETNSEVILVRITTVGKVLLEDAERGALAA